MSLFTSTRHTPTWFHFFGCVFVDACTEVEPWSAIGVHRSPNATYTQGKHAGNMLFMQDFTETGMHWKQRRNE